MESGIHRHGIRNPQAWNPESKTLLDYLTWGENESGWLAENESGFLELGFDSLRILDSDSLRILVFGSLRILGLDSLRILIVFFQKCKLDHLLRETIGGTN